MRVFEKLTKEKADCFATALIEPLEHGKTFSSVMIATEFECQLRVQETPMTAFLLYFNVHENEDSAMFRTYQVRVVEPTVRCIAPLLIQNINPVIDKLLKGDVIPTECVMEMC